MNHQKLAVLSIFSLVKNLHQSTVAMPIMYLDVKVFKSNIKHHDQVNNKYIIHVHMHVIMIIQVVTL